MDKKMSLFSEYDLLKHFEDKKILKSKCKVLWFTGLSGSGKSTVALNIERKFTELGVLSKVLDGDILRGGLNNNLGFSVEDRMENIRRTAEVAKLFSEMGIIVIVSFITPSQIMRNLARNIIGGENFLEIYINSSLDICEQRDVKGLYQKARKGEILNFTGISAHYEVPQKPDIEVKTDIYSIEQSVQWLFQNIELSLIQS